MGEFVNGYREGEGELRYKNGTLYKGSFKKGLPDGTPALTEATGP